MNEDTLAGKLKLYNSSSENESSVSAKISYALDINNLSKSFKRKCIGKGGYTTLKSFFLNLWKKDSKNARTFNSSYDNQITFGVKDITLRIPQGASVGVIGRNGSGKSTLLKLITGIYKPDRGEVKVDGRLAALIELGAGFHPDFSGRENVYLSAIMYGLTRREVDQRFSEIVSFAELEDVIDHPVRTYSSGMFMRLGFSVAIHTDPQVLLIDEVLAVGDVGFITKCKERLSEFRKNNKTLILVSHDLEAVERWCDEVLWLHKGEVKDRGEPRRVIDHYREFIEKGEEAELIKDEQMVSEDEIPNEQEVINVLGNNVDQHNVTRWGSREAEILKVVLHGADDQQQNLFYPGSFFAVEIFYQLNDQIRDLVFGLAIHRSDGLIVLGTNTDIERVALPEFLQERKKGRVSYRLPRLGLLEGRYTIDIAVHRTDGYPYDYHKNAATFIVRTRFAQLGVIAPQNTWEFDSL